MGVMVISQPILTPIQQITTTATSLHTLSTHELSFFVRNSGHVVSKAQDHEQSFSWDHE